MIKVKAKIYKTSLIINDLPLTHRWFIGAMFVALMYGASLLFGVVLGLDEIDGIKNKESLFIQNKQQFNSDLKKLRDLEQQPEKILIENKTIEVNNKIDKIDKQIDLITRLLIDPKTMTQLLDNIVRKQNQLTLKSLKSIDHVKQEELGLYQHQLEITLEGGFVEISRYLHDLEAMPFKVYWKSINYEVLNNQSQIPIATVVLTIYTLSRQGGWLGV